VLFNGDGNTTYETTIREYELTYDMTAAGTSAPSPRG